MNSFIHHEFVDSWALKGEHSDSCGLVVNSWMRYHDIPRIWPATGTYKVISIATDI